MTRAVVLLLLSACHHTHEPASFGELFAGTKAPALSGPVLGGVDWKMAVSGAKPTLGMHATPTLDYMAVGDQNGQLKRVVITSGSTSDSENTLRNLWGPPARTNIWYGDHVMAELATLGQDRTLTLVHIIPLAEELGTGEQTLGFEREKSLIGSTLHEIQHTYQDVLQDAHGGRPAVLAFPPDELDSFHVILHFDAQDVVTGFEFYVHTQSPLSDARKALIAKRFGATPTAPNGSRRTTWAGHDVEIIGSDLTEMWSVIVSKPE